MAINEKLRVLYKRLYDKRYINSNIIENSIYTNSAVFIKDMSVVTEIIDEKKECTEPITEEQSRWIKKHFENKKYNTKLNLSSMKVLSELVRRSSYDFIEFNEYINFIELTGNYKYHKLKTEIKTDLNGIYNRKYFLAILDIIVFHATKEIEVNFYNFESDIENVKVCGMFIECLDVGLKSFIACVDIHKCEEVEMEKLFWDMK